MLRRTLIDFFADLSAIDGEFIIFDDGYRSWSYTYADIAAAAGAFAARLRGAGITSGQSVVVWGENRAEWIVAMWGCILEGVVLVPVDYRASADSAEADHPHRRRQSRAGRRRHRARVGGATGVEIVGIEASCLK